MDIIGVILLWRFGLPLEVRRDGHGTYLRPKADPAEIAKGKRYDLIAKVAIALIVIGFGLQLWGTLAGRSASTPPQAAPVSSVRRVSFLR